MIKRLLDIFISAVAMIVLSPVIAVVAVMVALFLGRPVLFTQTRPGLGGQPFRMVKFRTMTDAVDASGTLLPDSERLTRLGKLLRTSSLDELPELWNVLCGDMSLVGPRPLLMEYLPLYTPDQARRHDVRPGLTGWAQVNGRNAISWDEKFEYDLWYIDHHNTLIDLRIMALTGWRLIRPRGINAPGMVGQTKFLGSEPKR